MNIFRILLTVIILKTFFLSKLTNLFYLNTIYFASIFLLIKTLNLFITNYISDENIILAYFEYFLDYLQLYLIMIRDIKSTKMLKMLLLKVFLLKLYLQKLFLI